jgi:hypothetical protein
LNRVAREEFHDRIGEDVVAVPGNHVPGAADVDELALGTAGDELVSPLLGDEIASARAPGASALGRAESPPPPRACGRPPLVYLGVMSSQRVPGGVVHKLPADLRGALIANDAALAAWKDITSLARNEFICWVEDAKQEVTRERRIRRTQEELEEGQRRPCCWPGCKHRERTGR